MPRICSEARATTADFRNLMSEQIKHGETNDCSVKAVAVVCGVSYAVAHEALRVAGRKNRKGAYTGQIHNAMAALGKKVVRVSMVDIIAQYPKGHCDVLKSITTHHPARFNKVWANGKTYIGYTKSHVAAIVDGTNHDWTVGRAKRLISLYEVVDA